MDAPSKEAIETLRSQADAKGSGVGRRMVIPLTDEAEHFLAAQGFKWNDTQEFMVRDPPSWQEILRRARDAKMREERR